MRFQFESFDECPTAILDASQTTLGEQIVDSLTAAAEPLGGLGDGDKRGRGFHLRRGAVGDEGGGPGRNALDLRVGKLNSNSEQRRGLGCYA
jgi:hypothetical protein